MPLPLLLLAPPREAHFDVLLKGSRAGVATYRLSDRPGGGRVTRLDVILADRSATETLSITDAAGAAVRTETVVRHPGSYTKEVVDYDARGDATISVGKGRPVVVRFDRRGSRRDPSDTWFRGTVPSPGTWAVFRALTPGRAWEEVRVTYVGRRSGGNLVQQRRGGKTTSFTLDDAGMLVGYDAGDLRLVRR